MLSSHRIDRVKRAEAARAQVMQGLWCQTDKVHFQGNGETWKGFEQGSDMIGILLWLLSEVRKMEGAGSKSPLLSKFKWKR